MTNPLKYHVTGNGPAILLIHAFPMDHTMWEPQIQALSSHYRVITPDVYGFGDTNLPAGGWSMDSCADALAEMLKSMKVDGPVVVDGLSMGGYIALAFARRHPQLVRGLILADTRAEADSPEAKTGRDNAIATVNRDGVAKFFEPMSLKVLGKTTQATHPEIVTHVKSIAHRQSPAGVIAALNALRDRPNTTADLPKFNFPTLVIVGDEDVVTPPNLSDAMVKLLPQATLEVIPGSGHLSNLESPDRFNAAVQGWLDSI